MRMFSLRRRSYKAGDWLYRLEGRVSHKSVQSCQDKNFQQCALWRPQVVCDTMTMSSQGEAMVTGISQLQDILETLNNRASPL